LSILIAIPLLVNIRTAYNLSRIFLSLSPMWPETTARLETMRTPSLQWVQPVLGEQYWTEPAVRMGLKVTGESLPWWTGSKVFPPAYLELTRGPLPEGDDSILVMDFGGEMLYTHPQSEYAIVEYSGGRSPCVASGTGGSIDVACENETEGILIVHENAWAGWRAFVDGQRTLLTGEEWLEVGAPAGRHLYAFRFLPADAFIGLVLTLVGIGACVWAVLAKAGPEASARPTPPPSD
jgi:hypothetical protein